MPLVFWKTDDQGCCACHQACFEQRISHPLVQKKGHWHGQGCRMRVLQTLWHKSLPNPPKFGISAVGGREIGPNRPQASKAVDDLGVLKSEDGLSEQPSAAPLVDVFLKIFQRDFKSTHLHLYRDTPNVCLFDHRSISLLFQKLRPSLR